MSAVKRVQKLLRHAEKRATSSIDMSKKVGEKQRIKQLAEASEELAKEPVYIKATGRAIEKAVNMGKWFEEKDDYAVEMKPGSVLVVDDIVPREGSEHQEAQAPQQSSPEAVSEDHEGEREPKKAKKTRSTKKNLAVDEDGDLLESRTRYVNTIEITVTLK
ncbi:hypothetical protein KEM55_007509 [Ascosphaera atra]|nr:hypothetical protein KEM55_007509 [Ascosphaera atra]